MPGPGNKKPKSKKSQASASGTPDIASVDIPTVLDAFVDEIDDIENWEAVVQALCRLFDLPDMETRSGLKKIHANFPQIQKQIDTTFAKYRGNYKVMGGIVGIWARMCVDSILRDRLWAGGLLEKMMPLLDIRQTRLVGLQALSAVTHHGGSEIRVAIAKHTPKLLQLMEEFPDNEALNEQITVTLSHAVSAVIITEDGPVDARAIQQLNMPNLLRLTMRNIRRSTASHYMLSHAIELLSNATLNCSREIKAVPSIVNLLVAALRSDDLTIRGTVLGGVIYLTQKESEFDRAFHDPHKFLAAIRRGFPQHLSDLLMAYDPTRCDTYLTLQCCNEHQKAMFRAAQDHDLLSLGRTLARLVVTTEYAVTDGGFQVQNPRTGRLELDNAGLPFTMWSDALQVCAHRLRETGNAQDHDRADIIELKFFISKQRLPEALALAHRAIARSPQVAYYHYALSLGPDPAEGLRACKKGLKCKETTPFVQSYLRWRAVDHAGELGLQKLACAHTGDAAYAEGIAFMTSALEDAKAFVSETSPDNRHMHTMLNWHIVLTIALRGKDLSTDLRELDDAFRKLEMAKEFNKFFGTKETNTNLKLTRELIASRYRGAWMEWGTLITRFDSMYSSGSAQEHGELKAEDNLSTWLEGLHVAGDDKDDHHCTHPKISSNSVALYQCSYCNNPSAVLRKCAGCGKTRYCDASCQKLHWANHKTACKATQAKSL